MPQPTGPISGSWKASPRATGAYVDRVGGYRRNWGVSVDPDHNRSDLPDPGFPAPVPPPPGTRTWVPPFIEDFFDPEGDPLPYFPAAEQEPAGHDVPYAPSGGVRPGTPADRVAGLLHERYRGADTSRDRPMVARQWDERYVTEMRTSLPATPQGTSGSLTGQALRALRGRNSLAVNNPGDPAINFSGNYVRQGNEIYRWTHRRMPYNTITPTMRVLHGNWAAAPQETTPVASPYTSYLPGGRGLTQGVGPQTPFMRREPRPWDEDAVRDGSEETGDPDYVTWGL